MDQSDRTKNAILNIRLQFILNTCGYLFLSNTKVIYVQFYRKLVIHKKSSFYRFL